MNARMERAIEAALGRFADYTDPKPRLEALYTDARKAWLDSRGPAHDLHQLLILMVFETKEVDLGDDAQIRDAYGIPRRDA